LKLTWDRTEDKVYNHHIVLADACKTPLPFVACPGAKAGGSMPISIFAAAGGDGGELKFVPDDPEFSAGFWLPKGDRVFSATD
jgi:hypothetical protein